MSNHHFHRLAGPFTILLLYTISFPFGSRQKFLHLGSRNLNVEPPFSLVGRTVYYSTTIYYFISIRFQAEVFASRVAKPECRTTIFTGRPAVYYSTIIYYFISIRFQAEVFASWVAKPECRTTIFTGWPAVYYSTIIYYFISVRFQAEVFASRVAKPECRTTIFTGRPDRLLFYYYLLFHFRSVPGRSFCISGRET